MARDATLFGTRFARPRLRSFFPRPPPEIMVHRHISVSESYSILGLSEVCEAHDITGSGTDASATGYHIGDRQEHVQAGVYHPSKPAEHYQPRCVARLEDPPGQESG